MPINHSHVTKTKVSELEAAICGNKNVVWLDVAVDDSILPQIAERIKNLKRVKLGTMLIKSTNILKKRV